MEILAIGNSFSRDATRYLHQIAKADGTKINVIGLAIGGCSLPLHYKHHMVDDPLYELWVNGEYTEFFVTIREALLNREWDVITIQQSTIIAARYDSYQPFLSELFSEFRKYCPKAKLALHETWTPQDGSLRLLGAGYEKSSDMYRDIHAAYRQAMADVNADILIPSATVVNRLISEGMKDFHEDQLHASLGKGRYALALTWYKTLTGRAVTGNTFRDFDVAVSEDDVAYIQKTVDDVIDLSKN